MICIRLGPMACKAMNATQMTFVCRKEIASKPAKNNLEKNAKKHFYVDKWCVKRHDMAITTILIENCSKMTQNRLTAGDVTELI